MTISATVGTFGASYCYLRQNYSSTTLLTFKISQNMYTLYQSCLYKHAKAYNVYFEDNKEYFDLVKCKFQLKNIIITHLKNRKALYTSKLQKELLSPSSAVFNMQNCSTQNNLGNSKVHLKF